MSPVRPYRSSSTPGARFHYKGASSDKSNANVGRGIPDDVVRQYEELVRPYRGPKAWFYQTEYGVPFRSSDRPLGPDDLRDVLSHTWHIAVYAPADGLTHQIAFDLDCKDGDVADRDTRYWAIRRLMGIERVPLVHASPSGAGLRVRYRIPDTPLTRLITGRDTGLVADVLRGAGIVVRPGAVELFPQSNQADRLPLGAKMPLLDPQTLEVLPDAAIGARYDERALRGALTRFAAWHAAPYEDLVAHLETLPGDPGVHVEVAANARAHAEFVRDGARVRPGDATRRLVATGLREPASRYHAEFRVALAGILAPELMEPFGLTRVGGDENLARAVARWLAEKNNGWSREWKESVAGRSIDAATSSWVARYLTRSATTGEHFVDRVRAAATRLDGGLRTTLLLADEERREAMAVAEAAGLGGSELYRAEVWIASLVRAVKSIVRHHLRAVTPLDDVDDEGRRFVFAPISARWMEGWAYGSGGRGHGGGAPVPNYIRYRQLLMDARWMRLARFSPTKVAFNHGHLPPDDMSRQASVYAVRMPCLDVCVRDVGVDARDLERVALGSGLTMSGRPIGLDEAHHMVWLHQTGQPLARRYGRRLGHRIASVAHTFEHVMQTG
jgi:hypothetical protein